jgi:hypothetical protein
MADKKISQLLAASTPLAGTEVLPIVQSGNTVKATVASITDRLGLGSMATQNANNVAVTGGSINGTAIGASTRAAGAFTDVVTDDGTHGRWTIAQSAGGNNLLSTTPGFAGYRTCALYASGGTTPNMTWGSDGNTTVGAGNLVISTSGKGAVGVGGAFLQNYGLVAAAGSLDLSIDANGFVGTLSVSATRGNYNPQSTRTVFAVSCYGTTLTTTSLHTQDGSAGSNSFSVTCPSAGVIRVTDTSGYGSDTAIYITFHGAFNYLYA